MGRTVTDVKRASWAYRRRVSGRITVPVAADPGSVRLAGRQCSALQPYMNRSMSSPGAVKVSATFSSPISTVPPRGEHPGGTAQYANGVGHVVQCPEHSDQVIPAR